MKRINRITARGTSFYRPRRGNWIRCRDGFKMSVIANSGAYCFPRPSICVNFNRPDPLGKPCGRCVNWDEQETCSYTGPFTHVEVGFPSLRPEPWGDWEPYTDEDGEVFTFVPVELVRRLIVKHRGERRTQR